MKKRLLILVMSVIMAYSSISFPSFATDKVEIDSRYIMPFSALIFDDYSENNYKVLRLFATKISQELDYSLLDGILTVEVKDEESAASCVLLVAEYDAAGLQTDAHIVRDVKKENLIGKIYGDYAKAFLWDSTDKRPMCPPISTKTDYEIIEGKDGEWSVSPDGHTLYEYLGEDRNVIIPNSYHGKIIKTIYNKAAIDSMTEQTTFKELNLFGGRNNIDSFVISEGISTLGPCAFYGCEASCPISLPSTISFIGNYAFRNCKNLTGDVNLPVTAKFQENVGFQFAFCESLDGTLTLPNIKVIPKGAFYGCKNLQGEINIPLGVEKIDDYAFCCGEAAKFTALTLPSSLKWIGKAAFQFQASIRNELVLPEGLEHIGDVAFNHCAAIPNTVLTIPKSLKTIGGESSDNSGNYVNTGYGSHVFYDSFKHVLRYEVAEGSAYFKAEDGVLYSKDGTRLVTYPPAKADLEFAVPEGVTQIDEMAFGHSKFATLHLPDSYVISETVPENVINNRANTLSAAMYHYNNLSAVTVNSTNPNYTSVNGILYSKDKKELWYVAPQITGEIAVEDGCEALMSGCCFMEANNYNGEKYTSIYIPASVERINENTLGNLNIKVNNKETRFIINLDAENKSFVITEEGKITKR